MLTFNLVFGLQMSLFLALFVFLIVHLMNVPFRLLVVVYAVKHFWFDFLMKALTELQAIGFVFCSPPCTLVIFIFRV